MTKSVLVGTGPLTCELLLNPSLSITAIAEACGFASSQHLATVFRKQIGITPSQYRRERLE